MRKLPLLSLLIYMLFINRPCSAHPIVKRTNDLPSFDPNEAPITVDLNKRPQPESCLTVAEAAQKQGEATRSLGVDQSRSVIASEAVDTVDAAKAASRRRRSQTSLRSRHARFERIRRAPPDDPVILAHGATNLTNAQYIEREKRRQREKNKRYVANQTPEERQKWNQIRKAWYNENRARISAIKRNRTDEQKAVVRARERKRYAENAGVRKRMRENQRKRRAKLKAKAEASAAGHQSASGHQPSEQ